MKINAINTNYRAYSQKAAPVQSFGARGQNQDPTAKLVENLKELMANAPMYANMSNKDLDDLAKTFSRDNDLRKCAAEQVREMIHMCAKNAKG